MKNIHFFNRIFFLGKFTRFCRHVIQTSIAITETCGGITGRFNFLQPYMTLNQGVLKYKNDYFCCFYDSIKLGSQASFSLSSYLQTLKCNVFVQPRSKFWPFQVISINSPQYSGSKLVCVELQQHETSSDLFLF